MVSLQNLASRAAMMADTNASSWSISSLLDNLNTTLRTWGGVFVVIVGIVMVIVSVVKIAKGLMSGGRNGQTNWVLNIVLFFLGGALAFGGGWGLLQNISAGGSCTLEELGAPGVVLPLFTSLF